MWKIFWKQGGSEGKQYEFDLYDGKVYIWTLDYCFDIDVTQ